MLNVTPGQYAALEAACDALIPKLAAEDDHPAFWTSRPSDWQVASQLLDIIGNLTPGEQKEFRQLLALLESRLAGAIFAGKWARFRDLPADQQEKILRKWMGHRINLLRKAFQTLKKLSMFLHYGGSDAQGNPTWSALGYAGPPEIPAGPAPAIRPETLTQDTVLNCDVVIVGSGSGGGVIAGILAEAGQDVIVVEKGPFISGEGWTQREAEMIRQTYDQQGALLTQDGSALVFAGSCLGGGSSINWSGSFPTPDYVLEEWSRDHGFSDATSNSYAAGLQAAMTAIHANADHSPHNPQNAALKRGSEHLQQHIGVIHRNVQGCQADICQSCGFCGMGCRRGTKQSVARTWLQRAAAAGARTLVDTTVQRVSQHLGAASGVEAWTRSPQGRRIGLRIRAKRVVVAAGSVQTPALLMRSGLHHPQLGRNLFFHPTVAVAGFYPEKIEAWYGPMMSAVNKEGIRLDGNYGYWVETPPLHPGTAALALPWLSGAQHKRDMLRIGHMASFIVLTRDKYGGQVRIDRQGNARVSYALHAYDRAHMWTGMQAAYEIHRAAGAQEVVFPHNSRKVLATDATTATQKEFLAGLPGWGWKSNQFALFTAHQMGTCALGGDPGRHPVAPDGAFRGLRGLYIADGSLMPTCAGINPMVSIMGLAYWVGKGME